MVQQWLGSRRDKLRDLAKFVEGVEGAVQPPTSLPQSGISISVCIDCSEAGRQACWRTTAAGCWLLVAGCGLMAAGCWVLAASCWLPAAGCWLLAAGCWLLTAAAAAHDDEFDGSMCCCNSCYYYGDSSGVPSLAARIA
jgi:hypothetical protein